MNEIKRLSFDDKKYNSHRWAVAAELSNEYISLIVARWELIELIHDLFVVLYLFQMGLNHWSVIFILNSSRLSFFLWNSFSIQLLILGWNRFLWKGIRAWFILLVRSRCIAEDVDIRQEFFSKMKRQCQGPTLTVFSILHFFGTQVMARPLRLGLQILGIFVVLPIYFSLLFYPSFLSLCLWIEIGAIYDFIKLCTKLQTECYKRLDTLWKGYNRCAKNFEQFGDLYSSTVRNIAPSSLIPKSLVHVTEKELIQFPQSVTTIVLSYLTEEAIIFDNWTEIPVFPDAVMGFFSHQCQVYSVSNLAANDPWRLNMKNSPNSEFIFLPY
jgi:hypothetical protein